MSLAVASPLPSRIVLLFVDGLGLRDPVPDNPVNAAICPTLCRLIREHSVPLDACLGVPGLPQSATGQATLFTGVNVPREIGKHVSGFPGPRIRAFIERDNLFLALTRRGVRCKFANGYFNVAVADIAKRRLRSVTTVMALTVPETISTHDDLHRGRAVTEDLTRHGIRTRGYEGPPIEPEDAAEHLAILSRDHGLVLFEYFQTDRVGHTGDHAKASLLLATYDRFLRSLMDRLDLRETLIVLTSDHGNIEAMEQRTHTLAQVPLVAYGAGEAAFRAQLRDLADVTPRILATLGPAPVSAAG